MIVSQNRGDKLKTTAERLKEAMEIRNMKQSEIIEKTGISKGALSSYVSGKYIPKQTNTYKIAQALNVDAAWLMGYDVQMEPKVSAGGMTNYELAALINQLRKDGKLQKMLCDFNSLTDTNKTIVLDLINALKEKSEG